MSTKSNAPVLVSKNVSVRFPLNSSASRWRLLFGRGIDSWHDALTNVSLSVPRGKIIGVIGRNGAGKSTLLRTLAGVYPLAAGRVIRLGPISALFELGGMGGLLMTGQQYVIRWLRLNGVPRGDWVDLIEEIRNFSELGDRLDDRIYTYSAGMAARLYFSTATSIGNEIYLIDEVLSVGDEHFQAKCWKRVRERLAKGVSGVLVTHDWSAIMRLCEFTCELEGGQIVAEGDSEAVICGYLKLSDQLDPNRLARFSDECPISVSGISGKNWDFEVPIVVAADSLVFFNYSIEKLILGEDWQILFIGSETLVASSRGDYSVKIQVPNLPLPSGQYRLNLFLSGTKPEDGGIKQNFDIRSWTTGNSIKLHVDGIKESALVKLPFITEFV
ncbi:ABC transporter ATP-binding protein [Polynucleobacter sp. UK-FUSCHL-C3]|uniref:ABC transporter ATP-binding protein n=1 Tax=Polynucleobacter sp. UK-FUSCHL-C3 TaxID=2955208 RepID=A0AAU8A3L0_9BURK